MAAEAEETIAIGDEEFESLIRVGRGQVPWWRHAVDVAALLVVVLGGLWLFRPEISATWNQFGAQVGMRGQEVGREFAERGLKGLGGQPSNNPPIDVPPPNSASELTETHAVAGTEPGCAESELVR